ncbi:MAG: FAD:protein FMN transferase [Candidatus Manganitrophus sp.]|nr:MAG: FAD:protein FMN transferase [Candidatus Manganitrophus sp.]
MKKEERSLTRENGLWTGRFHAMAGPCEVLIDTQDAAPAEKLFRLAEEEARRIERKFSRYRDDNIIYRINHADGKPVEVDEETAYLLDFAAACAGLSGGKFDITSGILRQVWRFDGSDRLPDPEAVAALLPRIGWSKVRWERPFFTLPAGMEIDFGGIGKEYAVDRTAQLLSQHLQTGILINYGGDLFAVGPRVDGTLWQVGIDDPAASGKKLVAKIPLKQGGLATSGDARRYLLKNNIRYSHILDPQTGWPVKGAPRSVTVLAPTCLEAGMLATFAMLEGSEEKTFLEGEGVPFWLVAGDSAP